MNVPTLNTVCPKCGSTDTQSFSIANKMGTTSGKVVGFGFDGDGGIASGRGYISNKTEVAKLTEPPTNAGDAETLILIVLVVIVCFGSLIGGLLLLGPLYGGAVFIVVGVVTVYAAIHHYNLRSPKHMAAFNAAKMKWEHSWICLRCGKAFFVRPGLARRQNAAEV